MVRGLHYSHGVRQSVFLMFNDTSRFPDFKVRSKHEPPSARPKWLIHL
jgi:hypothetical protein